MLVFETETAQREYRDISDSVFAEALEIVRPHTLTLSDGVEAAWALWQSIEHVVRNRIPGDIVECGVWSGGSMLLAALALRHFGDTSRRLWLYDTFAGIPRPEAIDRRWDGVPALPTWEHHQRNGGRWCYGGGQDHVRRVLSLSGYPETNVVFVEGLVEDTLPATRPDRIGLLRLDTDLYSSTYHELSHLYPMLSACGILLIDDYGTFEGVRLATDRFVAEQPLPLFLARIDVAVRLAVKPGPQSAR
jgi:hypothetical protein